MKFEEKLLKYLDSMEIFATEQIPDIFNQFLTYAFYEHIVYIATGLIMLLVGILLMIICLLKSEAEDTIKLGASVVSVFIIIISLVSISTTGVQLIKIKVAPKVYFIDKIKGRN